MSKKKSTLRFFVILFVVLASLGSIVFSGYLILDKVVVPKYFSEYGINGMGDLVGLMRTLYSLPNESEIITNAYSASEPWDTPPSHLVSTPSSSDSISPQSRP